eukprot:1187600-Rhodomonas_salina.2
MSGTDIPYRPMLAYEMSGTDLGYAATRSEQSPEFGGSGRIQVVRNQSRKSTIPVQSVLERWRYVFDLAAYLPRGVLRSVRYCPIVWCYVTCGTVIAYGGYAMPRAVLRERMVLQQAGRITLSRAIALQKHYYLDR